MTLPSYPPALETLQLDALRDLAVDWALAHGLVIRATATSSSSAVHAPIALFPSPFPRKSYEKALLLQPLFNCLVHKVAHDAEFLARIMDSLALADDFTNSLYSIYKTARAAGLSQLITLGIHRSDYLLHRSKENAELDIKQVELNTIASSFGSLSGLTTQMHKYLLDRTDFYNRLEDSKTFDIMASMLAPNSSLISLAQGIAKAHELYSSTKAVVMMIVQPNEQNAFDQRWLEYNLLEKHSILLVRKTLAEVNDHAFLHPTTKALHINTLSGDREISVVYFRAGYGPDDYPTDKEWAARLLIELSNVIKCPTIAYQLAGTKKVQQVLADEGGVERFLPAIDAQQIRSCFTGLYALDSTVAGQGIVDMAIAHPEHYVLKPQREGGGHNLYGDACRDKLQSMTSVERNGYILMDLIRSPPLKNVLIRNGDYMVANVISELGVYGIWVSNGDQVVTNVVGGHLLRTKTADTNEGGVAAGFAVLDSPLLV